jgi:hypothetical protein
MHAQGEAPLLELPLPEVDAQRLAVHCDDEVCHAGPAARAQPEELWRALEAPLLAGVATALPLFHFYYFFLLFYFLG